MDIARLCLNTRRLREEIFPAGLFADPAWDILLDLYTAEAKGEAVQISSLAAVGLPHSTAIRWARILTDKGFLEREPDSRDARRIYVRLSPIVRAQMRELFDRLSL